VHDLRRKRSDLPSPLAPGDALRVRRTGRPGTARGARPGEPRIRCPRCRWTPRRSDLWHCGPNAQPEQFPEGCGTAWHTFDTRGKCPGCGHQWRFTCCLRCSRWSPHADWYVRDEDAAGRG
jgi:hypothetical protein